MPSTHTDNARQLAAIDAKVADLKAAIREANELLKDTRAEHKELKAHLAWAADTHRTLLADMIEKSSAEVLHATAGVMATVARQLDEVVQRTQSVQTLARVDRLLHYLEAQLGSDTPEEPTA